MNSFRAQSAQQPRRYTRLAACIVLPRLRADLGGWLCFQRAAGIEHVYIYLHPEAAAEPVASDLDGFTDFVTWLPWPAELSETQAWQHAAATVARDSEWLLGLGPEDYVHATDSTGLIPALASIADQVGLMLIRPRWQLSFEMLLPAAAVTVPGYPKPADRAVPVPTAAEPLPQIHVLRPRAWTQAGQLAAGWTIVDASGAAWRKDQPLLAFDPAGLCARRWPQGLSAAACSALRQAADGQLSVLEQLFPAWRVLFTPKLESDWLQAEQADLAPAALAQRVPALQAWLTAIADASGGPRARALLCGGVPLSMVQAVYAAGYACDVVEARPEMVTELRANLPASARLRICQRGLGDGCWLDTTYDAVVVWSGPCYSGNLGSAVGRVLPSLALAQQHLRPAGLLLQLGLTAAADSSAAAGLEYQVFPSWQQPQLVVQTTALDALQDELELLFRPAVTAETGWLRVVSTGVACEDWDRAWLAIPGDGEAGQRLHRFDASQPPQRWLQPLAAASEWQARLGPDIAVMSPLPVATGRRCLSRLRQAAADRELWALIEDLRGWADFIRQQAGDDSCLPGTWLDALPAHVRRTGPQQWRFEGGEWAYRHRVDSRLVLYLGLWQVVHTAEFHHLLPAGSSAASMRWLAAWIELGWDSHWLAMTAQMYPLMGLHVTADSAAVAVDAYAEQVREMRLSAAIAERVEQRLHSQAAGRLAIAVIGAADELAISHSLRSIQQLQAQGLVESLRWVGADWDQRCQSWLATTEAEAVLLLQAGDSLDPATALIVLERLQACPQYQACYVDEDVDDGSRRYEPIFKPDFNLDLLRGYAYIGRGLVFRCSALRSLAGFDPQWGAAAGLERIWRIVEDYGIGAVGHIAEALYCASSRFDRWLSQAAISQAWPQLVAQHLDRLGLAHQTRPGPIPGSIRIEYQHASQPLVSVVLLAGEQLSALSTVLDSLLAQTQYPAYEVLIVDQQAAKPELDSYLQGIEALASAQLRVIRGGSVANAAAARQLAAQVARGDYLLWLETATQIIQPEWLQQMLQHAQRPEVGVVGARCLDADGRIAEAGLILGLEQSAGSPFVGLAAAAGGYLNRLQFAQNYTALPLVALLVQRDRYLAAGGFDADSFPLAGHDLDLCLKLQQAGYLAVWTPEATLIRSAPAPAPTPAATEALYRRWLAYLAADPAYNRNLSLDRGGFQLDPYRHIAWQPFIEKPLPRVVCHPADRTGCGHYRVREPFAAMQAEGVLDGAVTESLLSPVTLARFEADAIILQRQHTDQQREAMRRYLQFSDAFKVYELDDYMFNLPMKSMHRAQMPKDLRRQLRAALAMTDRFVVSTQVLAEQFSDLHTDIRVVLNRLPLQPWSGLKSRRRTSAKPRVGWGGGSSHTGDLEMIADVVRALADEVDWVFFGMCPDKLRPYVKEFHAGVPLADYPAALAGLNLDLALAPLEDHVFNHCKSNLRLLEYGACGYPVICSDLITYRCDLPVTRVKNRYKDWVAAIRMHCADLDASAAQGDALRSAVMRDWTLTGAHLIAWREAWLP